MKPYDNPEDCEENGGHSYEAFHDYAFGVIYVCRFCPDEKYESEKVKK